MHYIFKWSSQWIGSDTHIKQNQLLVTLIKLLNIMSSHYFLSSFLLMSYRGQQGIEHAYVLLPYTWETHIMKFWVPGFGLTRDSVMDI